MSLEYTIERPTLLVTFDTELLWGAPDAVLHADARKAARATKDVVMPALLSMLDELQVPATFAVVGHLLCKPDECGRPTGDGDSPEIREWYEAIPQRWAKMPEGFYWPEIIEMISACKENHEIALHSFSHWYFPSVYATEDVARFEVQENIRLLKAAGVSELTALVFPRNGIGHLAMLVDNGIIAYRSPENPWYGKLPSPLRRGGHLLDAALGLRPQVHKSVREPVSGLLEIPGSLLFMSGKGAGRLIPRRSRIRQIREGCNAAIRTNGIFHLWTHPMNLATSPTKLLQVFERGLAIVSDLVMASKIRVLTMSELARAIRKVDDC